LNSTVTAAPEVSGSTTPSTVIVSASGFSTTGPDEATGPPQFSEHPCSLGKKAASREAFQRYQGDAGQATDAWARDLRLRP
jgi:hypothetical protein